MRILAVSLLSLLPLIAIAADGTLPKENPYLQNSTAPQPIQPWNMSRTINQEEKTRMMKMMMPWMSQGMHMNIRDVMNYMTVKYKAKPGLVFDDVVESMKLRANSVNFKLVGHNPMWKDMKAVLDKLKVSNRVQVRF